MNDLPKAPASVVLTAYGNFWVEETAKRVSELRAEARSALGGDDEMVKLTGLESTGKSGKEGLIAYALHLEPMHIGGVRSMTQQSFENAIMGLAHAHGGGGNLPEGGGQRSSGQMEPRKVGPDLDIGEFCCCGHRLASHDIGGDFVGECSVENCDCSIFHTHD